MYRNDFALVATSVADLRKTFGEKEDDRFVGQTRRGVAGHEFAPATSLISRLLQEFALRGIQKGLLLRTGNITGQSGRKLDHVAVNGWTVLLHKEHFVVFCHRDDSHRWPQRIPGDVLPIPASEDGQVATAPQSSWF